MKAQITAVFLTLNNQDFGCLQCIDLDNLKFS